MSRVVRIQTDFASGEIDPLLRSRIDLKQYYQALQTAQNVFILPQGGAKRRDGLKFVAEIPSSAAPENGVRCIPFEFNTSDSYMFVVDFATRAIRRHDDPCAGRPDAAQNRAGGK